MKELKIITSTNNNSMNIDNIKHIRGNSGKINGMFNDIKTYFSKITGSEYAKDKQNKVIILLDNLPIDLNNTILLDLNNNIFDLTAEYKINQKTLFYYIFETVVKEEHIQNNIQTINILMSSLSSDIENELEDNGVNLLIDNLELDNKNIIKLIAPSLHIEGLHSNQYDYSVAELNLIKLNLFEYLIKRNKQKHYFLINNSDLPSIHLTKYSNVMCLTTEKTITNKIYDVDKKIDYENENDLYELYLNEPNKIDFKQYVEQLLKGINT